jgi:hypothetical protein
MEFDMEPKDCLAAKIDTEQAYHAAVEKLGYPSVSSTWHQLQSIPCGSVVYRNKPWWLEREALRITQGVYKTTEVIDAINQTFAAPMVLHISSEDEKMVAYTPTPEDGLRDKQIKTTLGRFLRKHYITLSDSQIQELEQLHTSEITAEFLLATTRDEIRTVYTGLAGDTGCMRQQPEYYNILNDVHPSAAYEAPGMGVAYTKDASGSIRSRAVVWVNPADESDKRYVRIYGSPVLRKILERKGYVCSSLEGAQLRKIPYASDNSGGVHKDHYVIPYLDGPDGNQSHRDGAYVVDEGDPEFFRLITAKEQDRVLRAFGSAGYYAPLCKSTGAVIQCKPRPSISFVSDKSGITFDKLKDTPAFYLKDDMTIGVCAESEIETWALLALRTRHKEETVMVWCPTSTPTFEYSGRAWLDNEVNRIDRGFYKLSSLYYPNATWTRGGDTRTIHIDGAAHTIQLVDARLLLNADETTRYAHVSEVPELRKQGYINCSPVNEQATLIHKSRPTMRRTVGGTVFDAEMHNDRFVELVTGDWVQKSSARSNRLFGSMLWTSKDATTYWAAGIPLQKGIDAVSNTSFGARTRRTFDNLDFEGVPSASVTVIRDRMLTEACTSMEDNCGWAWLLSTDAAGATTISQYNTSRSMTWADHLELWNYIKSNDLTNHADWDEMQFYCLCVSSVDAFLNQYVPKLNALIEQKKLEEAGQQRLADLEPVVDAERIETLEVMLAA